MHNEFRTFGQVMGLQLVRGILPESIDVYLNAAINETVRNIISKNVANSLQVGILPQAASITPINALRTLYRFIILILQKVIILMIILLSLLLISIMFYYILIFILITKTAKKMYIVD